MKNLIKGTCTLAIVSCMLLSAMPAVNAAWNGISYENQCNTAENLPEKGDAVLIDDAADRAPDGTAYLKAGETLLHDNGTNTLDIAFELLYNSKDLGTFASWETDIKFTSEGSGFSIRNDTGAKAGKINTTIVYGNNAIRFSKESGTKFCDASIDKWYHIKLVGVYGAGEDNAVMNISISEYQEDGSLKEVGKVSYPGSKYGDILRNDKAARRFTFTPGVCVDNVKFNELPPAAVSLSGATDLKAGAEEHYSAQLYADVEKTMPLSGLDVVYEILTADASEYLISDTVTITPEGGLLTVAASAEEQSFIIRAKCVDVPEIYDDIIVNVESQPMLEFVGAGFNEAYDTLVNLKFNQYYDNEGDISFIAAIYDENDRILDVYNKTLAYKDQKEGELIVTLNAPLPDSFDREKDTIKVFAWSKTVN